MATEQEEVSTDFPKVKEVDQTEIPHHPAADPTQENPYREESGSEES